MKKSVIFDLDGTLWDPTPTSAIAMNKVVADLGIPNKHFAPKDIHKTLGMPFKQIFATHFPEMSESEQIQIGRLIDREVVSMISTHGGRLYPEIEKGLLALKRHYLLFIVSNCPKGYLEAFLDWYKFGSYFSDFESHGNSGLSKAENINLVVQRNELTSSIYVGDTKGDHQAAREAGLPYIHVDYGFGVSDGPCQKAGSFTELVEALSSPVRHTPNHPSEPTENEKRF